MILTIILNITLTFVILYLIYKALGKTSKHKLMLFIFSCILGILNYLSTIGMITHSKLEAFTYIYYNEPCVCRTINFDNAVAMCGLNATYYVYYQACGFFTGHVYVECNNMTFNNYDGNDCITLIKLKCWYVDELIGFVCIPTI